MHWVYARARARVCVCVCVCVWVCVCRVCGVCGPSFEIHNAPRGTCWLWPLELQLRRVMSLD